MEYKLIFTEKTTSPSLEDAIELAKSMPSYKQEGSRHIVTVSKPELDKNFCDLIQMTGRWSTTRVEVDGKKLRYAELSSITCHCDTYEDCDGICRWLGYKYNGVRGLWRPERYGERGIGITEGKFDELSSKGNLMVMTKPIEQELRPVCEAILRKWDMGEKEKELVIKRVEKYTRKYGLQKVGLGSLTELLKNQVEEEWLKKAREFYKRYSHKVRKITEKKIERKPEEKFIVLIKRGGKINIPSLLAPLTAEGGIPAAFPGDTPEETDLKLLAECIKLNNSCIPRIWGISLFSDDDDFKKFSTEIQRELNIKVY